MTRLARGAAIAALAGLLLAGIAAGFDLAAFFRGWLAAFFAFAAIPIGALAVLFMGRLVPGDWAEELAPALWGGSALLPVIAVLLLPVLLGVAWIYPWAASPPEGTKAFVMTVPLFVLRGIVYVALWSALAFAWRRSPSAATASAGLIIWAIVGSLAGIDWTLSVEPEFHSSIFGLFALAYFLIAGLAFAIIAAPRPHRRPGALGAVLLSTVLLWMYLGAMQFIIIWSGDLPDETAWYLHRVAGAWRFVLWAIFLLDGAVPFALLLSARGRLNPKILLGAAGAMLAARVLEAAWLVLPAFDFSWPLLLAFVGAAIGIGGLLLATYAGMRLPAHPAAAGRRS